MASYYSPWVAVDDWRLRLDVSVSSGAASYTYSASLYVESTYLTARNSGCEWSITIDGERRAGTNASPGITAGSKVLVATASKTVARGTADRNVAFGFSGKFPSLSVGAYRTGTSGSGSSSLPKLASYTVRYDANGGTGAPGPQTKWYGSVLKLSTSVPSRDGHAFLGWSTSTDATVEYAPGASYSADADLTLHAVWRADTWTVSYDANGGTGAPGAQTKVYGKDLKLSAAKPTRARYNFKGWGTSPASTTVAYAPGATYTANTAATLYAIWEVAWTAPRISGLQAARCDSKGALDEAGTYAKVSFTWSTDQVVKGINVACNGATTTAAGSGTAGTVGVVVGAGALSAEAEYQVTVTVSDPVGSSSAGTAVPPMAFIADFSPQGGVALGKPAPKAPRLEVAVPASMLDRVGGLTESGNFGSDVKYRLMAKSDLAASNSGLAGGIVVRGVCGGFAAEPISVGMCVRGATASRTVSIDPISYGALGRADGAVVFLMGSDGYLYCYVKATGYYFYDLVFEGYGFSMVDSSWSTSMAAGTVIFDSSQPPRSIAMRTLLKNGYYGMSSWNGADSDWIRTPTLGLIPYQPGGASSLGTEIWPFNNVVTNSLTWTGNGLGGRVRKTIWSGSWSTGGSITVPDAPRYNMFVFHFDSEAFGPGIEKMLVIRQFKAGDKDANGTPPENGGWLRGGSIACSNGGDALYVAGITVMNTNGPTLFHDMRGTLMRVQNGSLNSFSRVSRVWRIEGVM